MPPDNIITSLKQGNALELEFIKKLRDGLDVIADGMQSECYKRGDALEELREMLDGVNLGATERMQGHVSSSGSMAVALRGATSSTLALSAEKKATVVKLIKYGIRRCEESEGAANRAHQYATQKARDAYEAERDEAGKVHSKLKARDATVEKTDRLLSAMRRSDARSWVYDEVKDVYHDIRRALYKDWGDWGLENRAILQRRDKRLCQAQDDRSRVADSNDKTITLLKAIARAAGVEDDIE